MGTEVVEEEDWGMGDTGTGNTELHTLAKQGDMEATINLLAGLSKGEQWEAVQARNNLGSTALHVAAYYGRRDLVDLLIEAGANPWHRNNVDGTQGTMLHGG